jgi:acyl-CoA thioester hydrolase
MTVRPVPLDRSAFRRFTPIDTRWHDNDVFGHVNNVVYYAYFDTAVNRHLTDAGLLHVASSPVVGLVAETGCTYFTPVSYPDLLEVGLAVTRLGVSSVSYRLGLFRRGEPLTAALCRYTHVYVRRGTGDPTPIPDAHRALLESVAAQD